jgi:hypothetical protein
MGGHPNFLTLIGEEPGRCLQTAETYAITDRVCVLADASTEKPQCVQSTYAYMTYQPCVEHGLWTATTQPKAGRILNQNLVLDTVTTYLRVSLVVTL